MRDVLCKSKQINEQPLVDYREATLLKIDLLGNKLVNVFFSI